MRQARPIRISKDYPKQYVTVVYDIDDLVSEGADIVAGQIGWQSQPTPSYIERYQIETANRAAAAEEILKAIQEKVAPDSWDVNGGTVTIKLFNGKLVAWQTSENHLEIQKLLEELRQQRQPQITVESRFIAVSAEGDEQLKQWMSKQLGITLSAKQSIADLSPEDVKRLIRETQKSRAITTLTAPRITVANGQGAHISGATPANGPTVRLPLLGGQRETTDVTFMKGTAIELQKVHTSPDGRFVTLSLTATAADLSIGKEGQIETETAKYSNTVSLPNGHAVLLRMSFVRKQIVGISRLPAPGSPGATSDRIVETPLGSTKPDRYLYILIKPTIITKSEIKGL